MTTLAIDTFTRANQTGFGTASDGQAWTQSRGTGSWSIASNKGSSSGNGGSFNVFTLGTKTPATAEVLVRMTPADTTSDSGTVLRFVDSNNYYYGILQGGNAVIGKDSSGSFSTLASATFSYSAGSAYWLRFRAVGTTLSLRAWADGSAEPGNWTVTTTDSTFASGKFGLGNDSGQATTYDRLAVTDTHLSVHDGCGGVFS